MFNRFEPNVKATIAFLKLLNVKVTDTTVDETLQNHPDWPSLLCISDSLSKWNIPNAAGKIEVTELNQLPTPFMAYTSSIESPLEIVTEILEKDLKIYSIKDGKIKSESIENFSKRWKGVYMIAEKTETSGEKEFKANNRNAFIKSLIPASLFLLTTILSILFLQQHIEISAIKDIIPIYLHFLVLFTGVIVSSLLLWYEIDSNNPLLHKVCTGIVKGNCDAILSGKQAKLFKWLSWSEVGFFYFAGGLLTLLFAAPLDISITIIGYLNVLALPYTVFSIYYQGRVAKQWCVLCLSVQALWILGGANVLVNGFLVSVQDLHLSVISKRILLYFIPVLLWYVLKPYLLKLQEAKNTKREYLRIKFNTEIFETLLRKQKQITIPTDGIGIEFGNLTATHTLVKVCNPHCGPCAKAHQEIEKILEQIPDLKVKIIFTVANHLEHPGFNPVAHLLILSVEKPEVLKSALDDWYFAEKKDYKTFAAKYPIEKALETQANNIQAMFDWCTAMKISITPTIFIDGYQLLDAYNNDDLAYFILE